MTQLKLYSIRDIKTDVYEMPLASQNDETAKRLFSNILKSVPNMRNNPEDFNLHCIGSFDNDSGLLYPASTVQFIISGLNSVKPNLQSNNDETTKVGDESPILPST